MCWREDVVNQYGVIERREQFADVGLIKDLPTKSLARKAATRLVDHVNQPNYRPGRVCTVEAFSEIFCRDVLIHRKPSYQEAARGICRIYINPLLGMHRLDQINGPAPQMLINSMARKGLGRKTILNAMSVLSKMLKVAHGWQYLSCQIDWKILELPGAELEKPQRFFTPEESQRIIEASPEPWNLCFAIMAYLGVRASEAVGIAWQHVDLETGVLMIRQNNWRGQVLTLKSKSSVRDLPLPAVLISMLTDFRMRWKPNVEGLLFANAKGQPITSCYVRRDILHPVRESLGIPRGAFHAFRHGLGTALMQAGANPRVVQNQLGHSDLRMLQRYAHVVPQDQRDAVDRSTNVFLERSAARMTGLVN
ncbi:MAG: integrase [Candidatus Sulfotelmatobacter sp.]|nr:integrase [Candidatus Sulfotelmatobacter sp.]